MLAHNDYDRSSTKSSVHSGRRTHSPGNSSGTHKLYPSSSQPTTRVSKLETVYLPASQHSSQHRIREPPVNLVRPQTLERDESFSSTAATVTGPVSEWPLRKPRETGPKVTVTHAYAEMLRAEHRYPASEIVQGDVRVPVEVDRAEGKDRRREGSGYRRPDTTELPIILVSSGVPGRRRGSKYYR